MKSFALALFLFCIAYTGNGQVNLHIFGGPQSTSAYYTAKGVKQNTTNKYGFQLGMGMKVPFENHLYFAPSAYYSMKGYKVAFSQMVYPPDSFATDNDTRFHNFNLAFLLQYDFSMKDDHFFLKVGPTLDFQLFGNEKFNTPTGMVSRKIPWGFDKYGHFGASMVVQLGYEMKNGFFVMGQVDHGLASINNYDRGPRIKHRAFGVSIGKYLGYKKLVIDTRNRE